MGETGAGNIHPYLCCSYLDAVLGWGQQAGIEMSAATRGPISQPSTGRRSGIGQFEGQLGGRGCVWSRVLCHGVYWVFTSRAFLSR